MSSSLRACAACSNRSGFESLDVMAMHDDTGAGALIASIQFRRSCSKPPNFQSRRRQTNPACDPATRQSIMVDDNHGCRHRSPNPRPLNELAVCWNSKRRRGRMWSDERVSTEPAPSATLVGEGRSSRPGNGPDCAARAWVRSTPVRVVRGRSGLLEGERLVAPSSCLSGSFCDWRRKCEIRHTGCASACMGVYVQMRVASVIGQCTRGSRGLCPAPTYGSPGRST